MAEYIGWNLRVFVFVFFCLFVPPCIFWSSSPFLLENVQAKAVKSSSIFLELDAPPLFWKMFKRKQKSSSKGLESGNPPSPLPDKCPKLGRKVP